MSRLALALILVSTSTYGAVSGNYGPAPLVENIQAMLTRTNPSAINPYVHVGGYRTNGDWGQPRLARWIPSGNATTNLGCVFNGPNGQWVFQDCESGEVDVRWFGATGCGVTDDGVTINAAIDYASTNKIVRIPLGSYLLTNFLVLNTGTKLVGDGIGKTYLLRGGTSAQTNSHLYATIQTPAVFNPYVTNGGHVGSVTCTVTNVSLEGFTLTTADGYHPGFGIALFGHQNAKLNNVEITGCTNHWAVTVFGNNTEIRGLQIRNAMIIS